MLPEYPSAARNSEYVCDLEYLLSRRNVGSYGPTEPHLWLVSKIPTRRWDDCHTTSERKGRTHTYDDLVDLLIELALERESDAHMQIFLKKDTWVEVPLLPLNVAKEKGLKFSLTPTRVVVNEGVTCPA